MSKTIRRLVSGAVLILVLALPAIASAHLGVRGLATGGAGGRILSYASGPVRASATATPTARSAVSPPAGAAATTRVTTPSFHWGDAALGAAAGVVVCIVLGLGIEARWRRSRRLLVS